MNSKILIVLTLAFLATACTGTQKVKETPAEESVSQKTKLGHVPLPLGLQSRLAWIKPQNLLPVESSEHLFTFSAKGLQLPKALKLFADAYHLNMVVDDDVNGSINVDFYDLPFADAMAALLQSQGYYWTRESKLIRVRSIETRVFTIDYIRLVRSGTGSSQAQVTSGSSEGSSEGDSGGGEDAGKITIVQEDKVDFWKELEEQLKILVSEKGRLAINRLAGTIQVTDQHLRVQEVAQYITQLNRAILRQVDIEVKIVEVTLKDDFSLGIDWSRLVSAGGGENVDFTINNAINQPAGGIVPLPSALGLSYSDISSSGENRVTAILSALQQQGEVEIVSQPRIRTLNNQSALIKVGTDRTFFRKEQLTDSTSSGFANFID